MSDLIKLVSNLNKLELKELGERNASLVIEEGLLDAPRVLIQARKAQEYLKSYISGLDYQTRAEVTNDPDFWKFTDGVELTLGSTGDRLDYSKDVVWANLSKLMKAREADLKLSHKTKHEMVTEDGDIIPKVPVKSPSKEVLKVKL